MNQPIPLLAALMALTLTACSSKGPASEGPDAGAPTYTIPDGGIDYGPKVNPIAYDWASALSYSGYRDGQSPNTGTHPSADQILQDLQLVQKEWSKIRGYRVSEAQQALDVIKAHDLPIRVYVCAWIGSDSAANAQEVDAAIALANDPSYASFIEAVIVGNESQVSWSDHLVSTDELVTHIRHVKASIAQPVTVADNWYWWSGGDANGGNAPAVAAEVDFILSHFYPVMEEIINGSDTGVTIATAVEKTSSEYQVVKSRYPGKYIGIGETGWPTAGSFNQTIAGEPSLANQKTYYEGLTAWAKQNQVLTFWFEGFDENWKDPSGGGLEAHWGLFTADRKPKLAVSQDF